MSGFVLVIVIVVAAVLAGLARLFRSLGIGLLAITFVALAFVTVNVR